jgi:DNA gyrase/topoisomerase IV subunit A
MANPQYLRREDVPERAIEEERQALRGQAREEGKPEAIIEKMVEGRLTKFFAEICLLEQNYIKDDKKTIDQLVKESIATIGENIKTLIFPLADLPEMGRGKGVKLQSFKQGGLADVTVFNAEQGPEWADGGGRRRNWPDWKDWLGKRAGAGRQGPRGLRKFR